jgi:hypothetical protein
MSVDSYVKSIAARYASGITTEHSFRGDLQQLIEELSPGVLATNEPKRISCGAPDYVVTRKGIPVGYVEAKDIEVALTGVTIKEQLDRYREALDNLIFTDYLVFRLYLNGEFKTEVRVAAIEGGKVVPLRENFEHFERFI